MSVLINHSSFTFVCRNTDKNLLNDERITNNLHYSMHLCELDSLFCVRALLLKSRTYGPVLVCIRLGASPPEVGACCCCC